MTTCKARRIQEVGGTEKEILCKNKFEAGTKFPNIQDKRRWLNLLKKAFFICAYTC